MHKWKLSYRVLMKLDHFSSLGMIPPPPLPSGHTFRASLFVFIGYFAHLFPAFTEYFASFVVSAAAHAGARTGRRFTCPRLLKPGPRLLKLRCCRLHRKRSLSVVHFVTFLPSIDPRLILPSFLAALCCSSHVVPVCPTFPSLCSSVFASENPILHTSGLLCSPLRGEVSRPVLPACVLVPLSSGGSGGARATVHGATPQSGMLIFCPQY